MGWGFVESSHWRLGSRVLREGCQGVDVLELQTMLAEAGFYFGPLDGFYGVLTEEAVNLAEKVFRLEIDGKAGTRVIRALKQLSTKTGRLIYTVKSGEDLEMISQKFGVSQKAWAAIAGQGNPRKKIFPGMKLLLPEKALFTWRHAETGYTLIPSSGNLVSWAMITSDGRLDVDQSSNADLKSDYLVISAENEAWEKVIVSKSLKKNLFNDIKKIAKAQWGLDLRTIPLKHIGKWRLFLKELLSASGCVKLIFLMVSISLGEINSPESYSIQQLSGLFPYVQWMMVEPQLVGDGATFSSDWHGYFKILRRMNRDSQYTILPMFSSYGWEWHGTVVRKVPWREAKLIRALNYRFAGYDQESMCIRVNYCKKGEEYQLYHRDQQGWEDLFDYIVKNDYPGIVLHHLEIPPEELRGLLADAFKVLSGEKLGIISGSIGI